jgi:hypothetical protein
MGALAQHASVTKRNLSEARKDKDDDKPDEKKN